MTPDQYTIQEKFIDVGNGHKLYVHEWGNPEAKTPIVFLHGGPGVGVNDKHKQRFTPDRQRVIFFDQRGAGKSTPKGRLEHNTTMDLIEDIEKIVTRIKLNKIVLTGGSWGSFLALTYAIKYPKRIQTMVLNGIFTARKSEIDYLDSGGFRIYFPDVWESYVTSVPKHYRHNPSQYHYGKIFGPDPKAAKRSAYAYSELLEGPLLSLDDRYMPDSYDKFDPDPMRIELHYLAHQCFVPEGYIMNNANSLTMPIWLVQGRYDMVCPPVTAYELHSKLPNSKLVWTTAGHGNDRPNYDVMRTLYLQLGM